MPLTREEWIEHKEDDRRQSEDITAMKLALFGDPQRPETVKHAVKPTMERLNNWLDAVCFAWRLVLSIVGVTGTVAAILVAVGVL